MYQNSEPLSWIGAVYQSILAFVCVFASRFICDVYGQIWRYGGIQCYIRLLAADGIAFVVNLALERVLPIEHISFVRLLGVSCLNVLLVLTMRMSYRYAYKCGNSKTALGRLFNFLLKLFAGSKIAGLTRDESKKIKIAIRGAGRTGVSLAEELLANPMSAYTPRCFVDVNMDKVDRTVHGIPVVL